MGFAKLASGRRPKMLSAVLVLNPDTSEDLRDSAERPAGLTNLGATCYANSILQCLYNNYNKSFISKQIRVYQR
jgi:ubiquitin carboxyl-terminal hydrolase 48